MSIEDILKGCSAVYLLAIALEFAFRRRWIRLVFELAALLVVVAVALLLNNSVSGKVSFGPKESPFFPVGITFVGIIFGIAARYFFYLKPGKFSWLSLIKPIMISPIVLLPLISSVQAGGDLSPMQIVSFTLLAFQNGFFWQAVLDSARPTTRSPRLQPSHCFSTDLSPRRMAKPDHEQTPSQAVLVAG